ncbi:MAG: DEAD/DEAH box helicase, partial [Proteobacteria bacterium]|nr:DEAD/DEAH box helicase [Pseudomonadota bacterium]
EEDEEDEDEEDEDEDEEDEDEDEDEDEEDTAEVADDTDDQAANAAKEAGDDQADEATYQVDEATYEGVTAVKADSEQADGPATYGSAGKADGIDDTSRGDSLARSEDDQQDDESREYEEHAAKSGAKSGEDESAEEESGDERGDQPDFLDDDRTFADLELQPEILQALEDMGYHHPMPVQIAVFDPMSTNRDIMVQSKTGTGKTAAFGIPIAQSIDRDNRGARVLALAPTRELALQVSRELAQITVHKGLSVVALYGGAPMKPQIETLASGAQIVVGTPGRVLDHLRRRTLDPKNIHTLVLDECDEMLSMGFQEEIENIISHLPAKEARQTVLFSATIPDEIQRIARRHMNEPVEISLSTDSVGVNEIDHYYYVVSGMARKRDLLKILKAERPESAIIFCNTRDETSTVARFLRDQGYNAEAISSDLNQRERERVMKRTREGKLPFLVATDVAARGIDISDLSHVINYTFPESPEVYVHRTGRTGRAGKSGVAISLVGPRELSSFYYLKLIYKIRPQERDLPTTEEMTALLEGERYRDVLEQVNEEPDEEYLTLARRVWQSNQGERIVAFLLQHLLTQPARAQARNDSQSQAGDADADQRRDRRDRGRREDMDTHRRDERKPYGDDDYGDRKRRDRRDRAGDDYGDRKRRDRRDRADDDYGDRKRRDRRDRADDGYGDRKRRDRRDRADDDHGDRKRRDRRSHADDDRKHRDDRERRDSYLGTEAAPAHGDGSPSAEPTVDRDTVASEKDGFTAEPSRASGRMAETTYKLYGADLHSAYDPDSDETRELWEIWADERVNGVDSADASESPSSPARPDSEENGRVRTTRRRGEATTRLYVNIGKREDITAAKIRQLLGEGLGKDSSRIGSIALRSTHCYVRVPEDIADKVISGAAGKTYQDREIVVERARR